MTGAIYVAGPLDYETRRRVSTRCPRKMSQNGKEVYNTKGHFLGGLKGFSIKKK